MTQQTIEIEGLPEGWKAVAYRKPNVGEHCWLNGRCYIADISVAPCFIVERIQPRRKLSVREIAEGYDPSAPNGYD